MIRRVSLLCVVGLTAAIVLVPSAAAGGGCHAPTDIEMSTGTEPVVGIGQCSFIDTVVYIEPGDEVTWINKDPVPHTVSGAANSWGTERLLEQEEEVSYSFAKPGVYPYYCAYHPSMVGAVVVGDATAPAALTNGIADVEEVDIDAAAPATKPSAETGTGSSAAIALAVVAAVAVVAFATRTLVRRREPSATPVP